MKRPAADERSAVAAVTPPGPVEAIEAGRAKASDLRGTGRSKRPTAEETREAAAILRRVLRQVEDGALSDGGAVGVPVLRHLRGALVGLEAAIGDTKAQPAATTGATTP